MRLRVFEKCLYFLGISFFVLLKKLVKIRKKEKLIKKLP